MLMVSTYDKAVGYDLEVGLDGACNGAVQNISGLIWSTHTRNSDRTPAGCFNSAPSPMAQRS